MSDKKKKTDKVIPLPTRPKKAVRAVITYRFATCTCGEKIKLEPGPVLKSSKGLHSRVLVAVRCAKCNSHVELGGETGIIPPPGYD
jgi:hypothetical protein